ncbi:lectin subunit alpha-like [Lucilia cuprina]|uniref:lectin subunit alpha-like n=1 Tax=Lucilia cuprina TaxID=7375 RepID=UPI001F05BAFD|nr:lectin subunit alpha-like [Lucilia cuprina]
MRLIFYFYVIAVFLLVIKVKLFTAFGRVYETNNKNKFYIENDQKYNWVEAFSSCLEMNMSLVTIESASKSNEINRLVQDTFGKRLNLWIAGVRNRYPIQHFVWLPSAKKFSYTYWEGQNPDFSGAVEYCVHIGWGSKMEWNDKACNFEFGFICEPNHQLLEKVGLQQQLQQEIEKQQKLQTQLMEWEKREKSLLQELQSIKESLKLQKGKTKEYMEKYENSLELQLKCQKYHINFNFRQDQK